MHIDEDHLDPVHPPALYTSYETRDTFQIIQILYSKVRIFFPFQLE